MHGALSVLLRYRRLEKAFRLAVDIAARDLFMVISQAITLFSFLDAISV